MLTARKRYTKLNMNKTIRYIFFGTPEFAAIILKRLIDVGMAPVAVVTNPDRPVGRKKVVSPAAVKQYLLKENVHEVVIAQPERFGGVCINDIIKIGAEVGILAAYGKIIPHEVIAIFPKGIVVIHPSLLPFYRGPTPIQSALLNGDKETGTTLFLMDEEVDHGPILAQSVLSVTNSDIYETLSKKLAEASADLLIEKLPHYLRGDTAPQAQDDARATYTKKFTSADGFVDFDNDAPEKIWRMVRALNPKPGVWTTATRILLASLRASRSNLNARVKLLAADYTDGKLILKKIQFAGKKPKNI